MDTKKIFHTNSLVKDGETFPIQTRKFTSLEALENCHLVHLGWGGEVLVCTPTLIQVRSRCMGNVDTDNYSVATVDVRALRPLYLLCRFWPSPTTENIQELSKSADLGDLAKGLGIDPEQKSKFSAAMMRAITEYLLEKYTDHMLIQKLVLLALKSKSADALAILDMLAGDELPPSDVLSLLQ